MSARAVGTVGAVNPDGLRPGQLRNRQRRALARYVRYQVHPYSALDRDRLDRAGVGGRIREVDDLRRLTPVTIADLPDPAVPLLRPSPERMLAEGEPSLRWHVWWARRRDRGGALNTRLLDPVYKPIHWTFDGGWPVGWSSDDLDRLAELGRRWLEAAGVVRNDVVVDLVPPGPRLAYWELVLGARRAGVSAIHLGELTTARDLARLSPSVLAGTAPELTRVLRSADRAGVGLPELRGLLVTGDLPSARERDGLWSVAPDSATVTVAWAPPGVRSLWAQCPDGDGLHTWPDEELVELADPESGRPVATGSAGEVVWTPIGWRGTVVLRLATGVIARLEDDACPHCGRLGPRVLPAGAP